MSEREVGEEFKETVRTLRRMLIVDDPYDRLLPQVTRLPFFA
jgi:hypothetical protein